MPPGSCCKRASMFVPCGDAECLAVRSLEDNRSLWTMTSCIRGCCDKNDHHPLWRRPQPHRTESDAPPGHQVSLLRSDRTSVRVECGPKRNERSEVATPGMQPGSVERLRAPCRNARCRGRRSATAPHSSVCSLGFPKPKKGDLRFAQSSPRVRLWGRQKGALVANSNCAFGTGSVVIRTNGTNEQLRGTRLTNCWGGRQLLWRSDTGHALLSHFGCERASQRR